MTDDEIRIPWGLPGPTDPGERGQATSFDLERFELRRPVDWPNDGIPDDQLNPPTEADV